MYKVALATLIPAENRGSKGSGTGRSASFTADRSEGIPAGTVRAGNP